MLFTVLALAILAAPIRYGTPPVDGWAGGARGEPPRAAQDSTSPTMKKITPIIAVDAIEPCLLFWTGLGFKVTVEVPHEDTLGFAMLEKGDLDLMYQSKASIAADLEESGAPTGLADELAGSTAILFVEVESVDDVLASIDEDADLVVPRRETFYGMDEIFVRAPCGTIVGFAARVAVKGDEGASD